MKGWGEGWVQRPGGGNVLGGFQVWRRLVLRRMGEQRAPRSRGSREATGDSGIRVTAGCRATESWRAYESGVVGARGCGTIADSQQPPWLL